MTSTIASVPNARLPDATGLAAQRRERRDDQGFETELRSPKSEIHTSSRRSPRHDRDEPAPVSRDADLHRTAAMLSRMAIEESTQANVDVFDAGDGIEEPGTEDDLTVRDAISGHDAPGERRDVPLSQPIVSVPDSVSRDHTTAAGSVQSDPDETTVTAARDERSTSAGNASRATPAGTSVSVESSAPASSPPEQNDLTQAGSTPSLEPEDDRPAANGRRDTTASPQTDTQHLAIQAVSVTTRSELSTPSRSGTDATTLPAIEIPADETVGASFDADDTGADRDGSDDGRERPAQVLDARSQSVAAQPAMATVGTVVSGGAVQTVATLPVASDGAELARHVADAARAVDAPIGADRPVTTLRIQLNPLDLGTVVATLDFSGERLRVDIAVTTDAAHRRLSADRDTITRALGDLGFDVEQVTLQQVAAPATASSAPRDGTAFDARSGQPNAQPQASGREGDGTSQRERQGTDQSREQAGGHRAGGADGGNAASGGNALYI